MARHCFALQDAGDNWFHRDKGLQWVAIKGDHVIEIK